MEANPMNMSWLQMVEQKLYYAVAFEREVPHSSALDQKIMKHRVFGFQKE